SKLVGIASPGLIYFNKHLDMYLFAKEFFQVFPGLNTYFLYSGAFMAYYYSFLGIALYHDNRLNPDDVIIFQKFLGFNLYGIRNFLIIVDQYLFANGFIYKKALRLIGKGIFRVVGR